MFIALSVLQGIICVDLYILSRPGDKLISLSALSEWGIIIYHNKWFQILSYVLPLTPPLHPYPSHPVIFLVCVCGGGGGGVKYVFIFLFCFMYTFLLMLHSVFTLVSKILCYRNGHYRYYYYYLELTTKPYNQSWYGGIFSWAGVCCGKIGLLPSGSGW